MLGPAIRICTAAIVAAAALVVLGDAVAGVSGSRATGSLVPGLVDVRAKLAYQAFATVGTGMVVDKSGEVLTNNHVIRDSTSILISDPENGRTYSAIVVGYDAVADVAVLKLEHASGVKTIRIGNSSQTKVGDSVTAIGNAGGTGGAPKSASGKIVAFDQSITAIGENGNPERLTGLIEMSAPTQPGDSGGPLVDAAGKVIGMDTAGTAKIAIRQSNADDGFAIPIDRALLIANEIEHGRSSAAIHVGPTAFLGVDTESPGYDPNFRDIGALVTSVLPGTPASRAGLAHGDIIYAVNGQTVSSPTGLTDALDNRRPGATVELGWIDQAGKTHQARVRLANGPAQ